MHTRIILHWNHSGTHPRTLFLSTFLVLFRIRTTGRHFNRLRYYRKSKIPIENYAIVFKAVPNRHSTPIIAVIFIGFGKCVYVVFYCTIISYMLWSKSQHSIDPLCMQGHSYSVVWAPFLYLSSCFFPPVRSSVLSLVL